MFVQNAFISKNPSNNTDVSEMQFSRHETYDGRSWDELMPDKVDGLFQQNESTSAGGYTASSTTPFISMNTFVPIPSKLIPFYNIQFMSPTSPYIYPSDTYYRSFAKYHEILANNFTTIQPPVAFPTSGILNGVYLSNMTNHSFASSSNLPQEVVQGNKMPSSSNGESARQADMNAVSSSTTSKPFICEECKKRFSLKRILTRHMKWHLRRRFFDCWFCEKAFNDSFDLKRHVRTHTGVRPYKCDVCEKSFTQRCSLESHLKKIHSIKLNYGFKERRSKLYVCEDCNFISKSGSDYQAHIRLEHPDSAWLVFRRDKAPELKLEKIQKLKQKYQGVRSSKAKKA